MRQYVKCRLALLVLCPVFGTKLLEFEWFVPAWHYSPERVGVAENRTDV